MRGGLFNNKQALQMAETLGRFIAVVRNAIARLRK